MESNSSKSQFIQQLIDESLQYQMLYKAEKSKNDVLDATIKTLHITIAEKDYEIKDLKQKNQKYLMEIGANTARNHALNIKYKELEQDISILSIKNYELSQKLINDEKIHIQNLRVLLYEYSELRKLINHNNSLNLLFEF